MSELVVAFIPCCKSKDGYGKKPGNLPYTWPPDEMGPTWQRLSKAREGMRKYIDDSSELTPALFLYTGHFYRDSRLKKVAEKHIYAGRLRLFIISAGYGVVDAYELIHKYEAKMEGPIANYWLGQGLVEIMSDICLTLKPSQIYGFFAGKAEKGGASAKYRFFFTEAVKKALQSGLTIKKAGCFYRESGGGTGAICKALGNCFSDFAGADFSPDFVETIRAGKREYDGVGIGFDDLGVAAIP